MTQHLHGISTCVYTRFLRTLCRSTNSSLRSSLSLCRRSAINSEYLPGRGTGTGGRVCEGEGICMLMTMMRVKWNEAGRGTRNNQWLSGLFQMLYSKLCENFGKDQGPVILSGLKTQVNLTPDNMIELVCTCMSIRDVAIEDGEEGGGGGGIGDGGVGEGGGAGAGGEEKDAERKGELAKRALMQEMEKEVGDLFGWASVQEREVTTIIEKLSDMAKVVNKRFSGRAYEEEALRVYHGR